MSVSDTRRMEMYETLIDRLGGEPAATLMEFLPPGGWENVATKIDTGFAELRGEMETGFTAVHSRIDGLDSRIDTLDSRIDGLDSKIDTGLAAVHSRIDTLDGRIDGLDSKIDSTVTGLRGEFALAMARQTRTIVVTMVGIAITIWLALLLPIGAGG